MQVGGVPGHAGCAYRVGEGETDDENDENQCRPDGDPNRAFSALLDWTGAPSA